MLGLALSLLVATAPVVFGGGTAKRVACLGDSTTATNVYSNPTYPQRLETLLVAPGWRVTNFGVGGNTSSQILSRWESDIKGKGYTHLVFFGGINDFNQGSTTAAAVWANLQTIYTEAKAAGMTVVIMSILPEHASAFWTSDIQSRIAALTALIVAGVPASDYLDLYAAMGDTDPTYLKSAWDSGDGLHPNQTGSNQMATLVKAKISP